MSTGGFAARAFASAGSPAFDDDIHVGEAAQGLSDAQQRPETSNWLPQVADIARRLPQITASQAALATIQAGTVNKLATPTAQQIAGAGGMAGFGLAGGTGGGGGGLFGKVAGAIGEARFLASDRRERPRYFICAGSSPQRRCLFRVAVPAAGIALASRSIRSGSRKFAYLGSVR